MPNPSSTSEPVAIGAVSFLNTKPLVAGLREDPNVRLTYAVPSRLLGMLRDGRVAVALVPVVDLTSAPPLRMISDACIASDGETLTVRVFSRIPPSRIERLQVDGDSHTSVILARLIWLELFGRTLTTTPLSSLAAASPDDGILLIGDKVVSARPCGFAFEVDLGAAWREVTGLPFVYAAWAALAESDPGDLPERLSASRDVGVKQAERIAESEASAVAWPVEIARRYLTETMHYHLTDRHQAGMDLFIRKATEHGLLAPCPEGPTEEDAV